MSVAAAGPDDRLAAALRGFGPLGILALLVILLAPQPFGGFLVLLWAVLSRTPWRALGFARPRSRTVTIAGGLVLGAALKLVMKALVMPLLGAPAINPAYHFLTGNPAALPGMLFLVLVGAGFGEETVFRGFLFERLGKLLGRDRAATAATVLLTTLWFGAAHYPDQGLPGVEQALITGAVFGVLFARTRRLWLPMAAHAAFDLTAVAIIYGDLERRVAHLIFR